MGNPHIGFIHPEKIAQFEIPKTLSLASSFVSGLVAGAPSL
jgi:hypothetical protein